MDVECGGDRVKGGNAMAKERKQAGRTPLRKRAVESRLGSRDLTLGQSFLILYGANRVDANSQEEGGMPSSPEQCLAPISVH